MRSAFLPIVLGLLLTACGGQNGAETAPPAPAPQETPAPETVDDTAAAPETDGDAAPEADPAGTPAPSADDQAAATDAPAAAPAARPAGDPQPVPGLTLGQDYDIIRGGQRYASGNGIEVAEVFAYWCGACAQFDPLIESWKKRQPADVDFVYVPAVFDPNDNMPRAFFAAEANGLLDKTHSALFRAIHLERSVRPNASIDDLAGFFAKHGLAADAAKGTMESFSINARLGRARQFATANGVTQTPMLIVNGRYRAKGRNWDDMLRITDALVAQERAAQQP